MKTACIFPGQGSQYVGMGRDLYDAHPAARATFDEADGILGAKLSDICFEGPEELLRETRYTQSAILVHSVAVWRMVASAGFRPDFVAGHSVGEYSALVASGSLEFADALRLVKERGEAMYRAGLERPGAMAALIGVSEENVGRLIEAAAKVGTVTAANYNSPVQVVISGEVEAVETAVATARDFGAKRAIRLNVSGAFHSPLMRPAQERLSESLRHTEFREALIPVVANVTGRPARDPVEIAALLERQLVSPVRWSQSMRYVAGQGVSLFAELGPGEVLCGLLKRIVPQARCVSCADEKSIAGFLTEVSV